MFWQLLLIGSCILYILVYFRVRWAYLDKIRAQENVSVASGKIVNTQTDSLGITYVFSGQYTYIQDTRGASHFWAFVITGVLDVLAILIRMY